VTPQLGIERLLFYVFGRKSAGLPFRINSLQISSIGFSVRAAQVNKSRGINAFGESIAWTFRDMLIPQMVEICRADLSKAAMVTLKAASQLKPSIFQFRHIVTEIWCELFSRAYVEKTNAG
jgi:hypothetical protein